MKANNLKGEYCQNCAAILDDVQRNYRRVIVLDTQCSAVFSQSGDSSRLDEAVNPKETPVTHTPQKESKPEHKPEPVKAKEKAPAKPAKRSKR